MTAIVSAAAALTDAEFLSAFAAGTLGEFHHRDHVRLTWLYLRAYGPEQAARAVAEGIQRFAAARGAHGLYHVTLTRAWVRLVAAALRQTPDAAFDAFAARHPELLGKQLVFRFYSRDLLMSEAARAAWMEPDLQPLP